MDKYQQLFDTINNSNYEPEWDAIVITASNQNQADSFLKQIEVRKDLNTIDFIIVPDKNDSRVGSGGSTLSAIRQLKEKYKDFSNKKFLVIHAGGDSKRCPQYSAIGKLFSPIPCCIDGVPATLFDLMLKYIAPISSKMKEGMFLLSGDVILLFDATSIELTNDEAIAISFKENVSTAKHHGVYLSDDKGYLKRFLHKQNEKSLNDIGAVDINDNCNIDTGAIYFSKTLLDKLEELVHEEKDYEELVNDTVRLSLYGDIEYCLANGSSLDDYYTQAPEADMCDELINARRKLWNKISTYNMKLVTIDIAKFVHFGSIEEIMLLMNGEVNRYKELGWNKNIFSSTCLDVPSYNSIERNSTIGKNVYLENSIIKNSVIGDNCYISSIEIRNCIIPDNLFIHLLKQNNGKYICRIMGIKDNPKENKIFGNDIDELIKKHQLKNVFTDDSHSLWNANLYIEKDTVDEAIEASLYVYKLLNDKENNALFNNTNRKSLCSGFVDADITSIIVWNNNLNDLVKINELDMLIKNNKSVTNVRNIINKLSDVQIDWIKNKISKLNVENLDDFSYLMRLYYYLGYILNDDKYIDKCFKLLSNVIVNKTLNNLEYNDSCKIKNDETVIELPLRANWGGGWSDTPPHCMEHGGTVINVAINLNGQLPVKVKLTKINEKKIIFESKDMNTYGEFEDIKKLQSVGDPLDPYALQKACLLACGIIPSHNGDLKQILDRLTGGFKLESNVENVPTGSGLGTSSILSAACVKAMFEFVGIEYDENKLCSTVLAMEQIMSTGGGWQDQIGGITNGIKFICSQKGLVQNINIEHIQISEKLKEEFKNRYCVIYTGKQRLAKNLLRDVVGRYVGNVEESIEAHIKIQEVAIKMKDALLNDNFEEFAKLLDYHWTLSKQIDAGSSNSHIEEIFEAIDDLIDARMIIGAGGGGFLQVVLSKGVSKKQIQERLTNKFKEDNVIVYESQIVY